MENPWNIKSLYELQFFNCPSCMFKNHSKQEIVNHAYEIHPESIEYLKNIKDESLTDIEYPWNVPDIYIKTEQTDLEEQTEMKEENFDVNSGLLCNEPEVIIKSEESDENFIENPYVLEENSDINNVVNEEVLIEFNDSDRVDSKNHKCEHCGKNFSRAENLKNHIKAVHEGVKAYKCDFCEKSFPQYQHLKTHVKAIHERIKDQKCDYCEKSFTQAGNLRRHIKAVHERVKQNKCTYCGKFFSQSGNLNKHIKTVHEV